MLERLLIMTLTREGSPWFLIPFHVRHIKEDGYSRRASWRLDPETQELVIDISATHPKMGRWVVHLNGIDLDKSEVSITRVIYDESGFSSGAGYQESLVWDSYQPNFDKSFNADEQTVIPLDDPFMETLRLLATGYLTTEGVTINTNGTVQSTDPSGIKVILSGEDGNATLVASSVSVTA